jgi:hypothetical protein
MEIVLEQSVIIGAALELHLFPLHISGEDVPSFVLNTVLHTHPTCPYQEISLPLHSALIVWKIIYALIIVCPRAKRECAVLKSHS